MAQAIPLHADERTVLGKKVKALRKQGFIPGHVFGNKTETEHVTILLKDFKRVYTQAGETGLIDLKIGTEKTRPVLVREIDFNPVNDELLHVGFYEVNLKEKVTVPVPIVLLELEEENELVKVGEAVILQNLSEVQVEALPTDLIDQIEVDIRSLKNIDDAITVGDLSYNRELLTVLAEPEEVVVKLAPAVTEEMKALMEEQEAEAEAAQEETAAEAGEGGEAREGEEGAEAEGVEGEAASVEDSSMEKVEE
jgi:large subunit ribosomal protein L25